MGRDTETAALLLRSVDYGESDRVCTLLTAARGKVAAFARGARGSKKRFRGGLGSFAELNVTLRDRGSDSMPALTESEAIAAHTAVGGDLAKVAAGTYALELLDMGLQDGQGAELFPTVVRFVRWLAAEDAGVFRIEAGVHRLELVLLAEQGLLPDLATCARTGHALDDADGARWLPEVGLVEPGARHAGEAAGELPPGALGYLRAVASGHFPASDAPAVRRATRVALNQVWRHVLGREPRSWRFYADTFDPPARTPTPRSEQ